MTAAATAQDSAYCRQVRARAASDAVLLMAPRLVLQELRFPRNNQIDLGATTGQGFQFRTGLSFSPVEFFKGLQTLDVGDAACREHEARAALQDRLAHARDSARLSALKAQASYLDQHRDDWNEIAKKAADRLSRRVITLVDFTRLSQLVAGLDRKLAEVEGTIAELHVQLPASTQQTLRQLTDDYTRQSAEFERELTSTRELDAWQLRVTGGVIAQAPLDWYGMAELNVSFGALARPSYEHAYQNARADDLLASTDELPARVRELRAQSSAAAEQARRELVITQRSLATLLGARNLLESSEAENVQHARDALTIERFSTESEVVFLQALIGALASAAE